MTDAPDPNAPVGTSLRTFRSEDGEHMMLEIIDGEEVLAALVMSIAEAAKMARRILLGEMQ